MRKLFYEIGAIATIVAPVAAVVSCSNKQLSISDKKNETQETEDQKIVEDAFSKITTFVSQDTEATTIDIKIQYLEMLGIKSWDLNYLKDTNEWHNSFTTFSVALFSLLKVNFTTWSDDDFEQYLEDNNIDSSTSPSELTPEQKQAFEDHKHANLDFWIEKIRELVKSARDLNIFQEGDEVKLLKGGREGQVLHSIKLTN